MRQDVQIFSASCEAATSTVCYGNALDKKIKKENQVYKVHQGIFFKPDIFKEHCFILWQKTK